MTHEPSSAGSDLAAFKEAVAEGQIPRAYRTVQSFISQLRRHLGEVFPGARMSGMYQGALDFTHFALTPPSLRQRRLKIVVVFNYSAFRFEAWLAGATRQVQHHHWDLLRDEHWPGDRVSTPGPGVNSIIERDLVSDCDFGDFEALNALIEAKTRAFLEDVQRALERGTPR